MSRGNERAGICLHRVALLGPSPRWGKVSGQRVIRASDGRQESEGRCTSSDPGGRGRPGLARGEQKGRPRGHEGPDEAKMLRDGCSCSYRYRTCIVVVGGLCHYCTFLPTGWSITMCELYRGGLDNRGKGGEGPPMVDRWTLVVC